MSTSFAEWLRQPHSNLRGTIQQPQNSLRIAYIRPEAFPEERLFFRWPEWTVTVTHRAMQGRPVLFDLEPQEWNPKLTPNAINVRLEVSSEQLPSRLLAKRA